MNSRKKPSPLRQQTLNRDLVVAVCSLKTDEIRRLLKEGADPNHRMQHDEPMLNFSAQYDTPEVVQLLIDYGADVNACDKSGTTPLHCALDLAEIDNAALLIKHGADINHQMVKGKTPPPWTAAFEGDRAMVSTRRTLFVLSQNPDFSLTFEYDGNAQSNAQTMLQGFMAAATDRNRDEVTQITKMIDGFIEERARIAGQKRIDAARREWLGGVQRKPDRKFKL